MEKRNVTVIRKSCLTGNAVWIYRGPSKAAATKAYQRAVKHEIEYVKNYADRAARRMNAFATFLASFIKDIGALTPQQREAVAKIQAEQQADTVCQSEFYDHIMEQRRRRAADAEIRRQMRERDKKKSNRDYVK